MNVTQLLQIAQKASVNQEREEKENNGMRQITEHNKKLILWIRC